MPEKKKDLQQALKRLEQITEELSSKDVDLEVGMKRFKEGAELIKYARGQLKKTENEFKKVKAELEELDEE